MFFEEFIVLYNFNNSDLFFLVFSEFFYLLRNLSWDLTGLTRMLPLQILQTVPLHLCRLMMRCSHRKSLIVIIRSFGGFYLEIVMSEMEMEAIVDSPGSCKLLIASFVIESTCAGSMLVKNIYFQSIIPVRTSAVEAVETSGSISGTVKFEKVLTVLNSEIFTFLILAYFCGCDNFSFSFYFLQSR